MKQINMTLKQHLIQFMKKVFYHASNNQPYSIVFIDSISIYFDKIQNHVELTCQFSTGDIHDLLRFIIFISEIIYINIFQKKTSFLSCETDQIISCCMLPKILLSIFEYIYQRHGSFIYLSDLFPSSQHLSNLYDEYFCTWFDEDGVIISLISYNLCKSSILLEQRTKEYNELYIHLIERNYKLITKTHAYASFLFVKLI
ncbi:unnamed protein product [Rotaria sp. Silwood1]|nr:unnamed protein product [Rotaria sp. Silwood1]CAF1654763.1 unnamed protein product [Rotaria sp. Silwood1]